MKQTVTYLFFLFCAFALQAQSYSSRKLAEIGELFPISYLPPADSVFICRQIIKGKSFVVKYNDKKEIEHLGISLFSPETKKMINLPVCNFIERMMLELVLQKTTSNIKWKLMHYGISLEKNGIEYGRQGFASLTRVLADIQYPTRFAINKDSVYTALWEFGSGELLSMSFPASRELIFGTDKKESDESIGELFVNNDCGEISNESDSISEQNVALISGTDLYLRKGSIFMINKINSDTYYQRSNGSYTIAFDSVYPRESLANLFLAKTIDTSLSLNITHRMYGEFTPEFTIPLNKFICLFNKGFTSYCVLYKPDFDKVQIALILHNADFNYIHLARIKTTKKQIFQKEGVLSVDLYTNIPLHNVKNLFNN
jgi:hypothetical protein